MVPMVPYMVVHVYIIAKTPTSTLEYVCHTGVLNTYTLAGSVVRPHEFGDIAKFVKQFCSNGSAEGQELGTFCRNLREANNSGVAKLKTKHNFVCLEMPTRPNKPLE